MASASASATRGRHHPAGRVLLVPGPDDEPGRKGDEEQCHGVEGGERAQVQRRAEGCEQGGGEEGGPAPEQPACRGPQRGSRSEHEGERQDPCASQSADAVG